MIMITRKIPVEVKIAITGILVASVINVLFAQRALHIIVTNGNPEGNFVVGLFGVVSILMTIITFQLIFAAIGACPKQQS
jgi:hypothetical protein